MLLNRLSEELLLKVKLGDTTTESTDRLAGITFEELLRALDSDEHKKAFWINIYNAFFQILRSEQQVGKPAIYRHKLVTIAGRQFSLDQIEHGILRKYRFKWALGYLPDPLIPAKVRKLAVAKLDYRIHFALNCGARSCPPIAFYAPEKINQQLELATLSFLEAETKVFSGKDEIHITRLFQWFKGDFGGSRGVRRILREKLGLNTTGKKLIYKNYDWTEELNNFEENIT